MVAIKMYEMYAWNTHEHVVQKVRLVKTAGGREKNMKGKYLPLPPTHTGQ